MGKSSAAPAAPDYTAAATAQGAANVDAARATAQLSNPNIISPYGNQTVTYGTPQFDQSGYDKAMAAYNSGQPTTAFDQAGYDKAMAAYNATPTGNGQSQWVSSEGGADYTALGAPRGMMPNPDYQAAGAKGVAPDKSAYTTTTPYSPNGPAPDKAAFTTYGGNLDVPTVTQTLSPNSQAVLDAQQKTQLGLANLSNNALGTAQGILNTPFQYQGPGVQTSLGNSGGIQNAPDPNSYALQNSYSNGGQIYNAPTGDQYGTAGSVAGNQYGSASGGPAGDQYGTAGSINANQYNAGGGPSAGQYGYTSGGPTAGQYGTAGGINAGQYNANGQLDLSQVANMPVNAGTTGQAAIMNRLAPQIAQDDASYANTLKNQGITLGSEAYDNAMRVHNQQKNDLLSQASLQGINLDLTANNQGYNQALQTGQFGNQAQMQNYNQNLGAQQLQNAAIGQNFGMGQSAQQMQNAAMAQNYGQNLGAQNQANAAIGQNFGQGQAATAMGNAAIGQNYNQGLSSQNQANAAIGQNYSQGLASMQAQNQAQQQQFGQNQSQFQDYNTAQLQQYQNALAQMQAQNAAQNQGFNQNLQSGQFANTAQQQAYQQQLAQRQMPLNEIAAMMSGSQIQNPQFGAYTGSQVAAAPVFNAAQAQYNSGLQAAGMANANTNSLNTGIATVGSAAVMAF